MIDFSYLKYTVNIKLINYTPELVLAKHQNFQRLRTSTHVYYQRFSIRDSNSPEIISFFARTADHSSQFKLNFTPPLLT